MLATVTVVAGDCGPPKDYTLQCVKECLHVSILTRASVRVHLYIQYFSCRFLTQIHYRPTNVPTQNPSRTMNVHIGQ